VVRFFHKQGYALKTPQPWPDKQDEQLRESFLQELKQLMDQALDEADKMVCFQKTTNIMIVDNATWHRRKDTHRHRWQPKYLPPYSPDLNPIERIWLSMKARWFNNYVCKNEEQLLERLDQAILDVINSPKKTQKTACIGTLL
jgi:transposase